MANESAVHPEHFKTACATLRDTIMALQAEINEVEADTSLMEQNRHTITAYLKIKKIHLQAVVDLFIRSGFDLQELGQLIKVDALLSKEAEGVVK